MGFRGQLKLFPTENSYEGKKGKRKASRPLVTKRAMHIRLRAEQARGNLSFHRRRNADFIKSLLESLSKKYRVRILSRSINSNHLHLLVQARDRKLFKTFMRLLAGQTAMFVTGAKKGKKLASRFWDGTYFSRVVENGRDFKNLVDYVFRNVLETVGMIPYDRSVKTAEAIKPFV